MRGRSVEIVRKGRKKKGNAKRRRAEEKGGGPIVLLTNTRNLITLSV